MKTYEVTDMAQGWLNVRTPIDYHHRTYNYDLPANSPVKDNQFIATQFYTMPIYAALNEEYWHHPEFEKEEWHKSPHQIRMSLIDGDDNNFECIVSSDLHHILYECDYPLSQNMEIRAMLVEDIFWEIKLYFDEATEYNGCAPEFITKIKKFFGSKTTSDFDGFLSPDVAVHEDGTGFDT